MTVPSLYSTKVSVNVRLAGADTEKGLGKVVSGITATSVFSSKVYQLS